MVLPEEDKILLAHTRVAFLKASTGLIYELLDWLVALSVFTWANRQVISAQQTDESRMMILIQTYETRASNLDPLKQALNQCGMDDILAQLGGLSSVASPVPAVSRSLSNLYPQLATIARELRHFYSVSFNSFRPLPHTDIVTSFSIEEIWVNLHLQSSSDNNISDSNDDYRSRVIHAFTRSRLVVCCANAGYGKTTLMRRITYDWSQGKLPQYDMILCAKLREVNRAESIIGIVEAWMSRFVPAHTLAELQEQRIGMTSGPGDRVVSSHNKYHTMVILDGLDESEANCTQLREFLNSPDARDLGFDLLITCLPYKRVKIFAPCQYIQINGFNFSQQKEYIERHFQHDTDKDTKIEEVNQLLLVTPQLAALAEVPLLLRYICMVYETLQHGTAAELFCRVCEWQIIRYIEKLRPRIDVFDYPNWMTSKIISRLGKLALHSLLRDDATDFIQFTKDELVLAGLGQKPTFGRMIRAIHLGPSPSRLYVCRVIGFLIKEFCWVGSAYVKVYSFRHRTMQEFFASLYLYFKVINLNTLMVNDDIQAVFRNSKEPNWVIKAKNYFNQWKLLRVYNFMLELALTSVDPAAIKNVLGVYTYVHPAFSANYLMFSGFDEDLYQVSHLSPLFFKLCAQHYGREESLFSTDLMRILIAKSSPSELRETLPHMQNKKCILGRNIWYIAEFELMLCIAGLENIRTCSASQLLNPSRRSSTASLQSPVHKYSASAPDLQLLSVETDDISITKIRHCVIETNCWKSFMAAYCKDLQQLISRNSRISHLQVHLNSETSRPLISESFEKKLDVKKLSIFLTEAPEMMVSLLPLFKVLFSMVRVTNNFALNGGQKGVNDLSQCVSMISRLVEIMNLSHLRCKEEELENFFEAITSNSSVRHLAIRNCDLSDQMLMNLAFATNQLGLKTLILANEPALRNSKCFESFCNVLSNSQQLTRLGLCGNILTSDSLNSLVYLLKAMPNLEWLSIYDNQICIQHLNLLKDMLKDNEKIQLIF